MVIPVHKFFASLVFTHSCPISEYRVVFNITSSRTYPTAQRRPGAQGENAKDGNRTVHECPVEYLRQSCGHEYYDEKLSLLLETNDESDLAAPIIAYPIVQDSLTRQQCS